MSWLPVATRVIVVPRAIVVRVAPPAPVVRRVVLPCYGCTRVWCGCNKVASTNYGILEV